MPTTTKLEPTLIRDFLPEREFAALQGYVARLSARSRGAEPMDGALNRDYVHNDPLLAELHGQLAPVVAELVGAPVKTSYVYAAFYRDGAVCPAHLDRPQCKYTLDLCVSQREPWAFYVEGAEYLLEENDALLFGGTESRHWRDEIQPGSHCEVVLFHFVDEDFEGTLE